MRGISEEKLHRIIGSLYESAYQMGTEPWIDNYREIAALLDSGPGHVSLFDTDKKYFHVFGGTTPNDAFAQYFEYYQHISPFRSKIAGLKPGKRFNRREFMSDSDFRRLEIYQDFYTPNDIFHLEYRVFLDHDNLNAGIAFSRPPGKPNFGRREFAVMNYLLPHLARAFRLNFSLRELDRQTSIIANAFDHLSQGVLIIDRQRRLVYSNHAGSQFIANGNGLRRNNNGSISTSFPNRTFERVVSGVVDRAGAGARSFGGALMVRRTAPLPPLELLVAPYHRQGQIGRSLDQLAIVFITDPESRRKDIAAVLKAEFGLTTTEARFAEVLTSEGSFAEACSKMSITQNTGRTHLKRIFSKTGTNRQAGLVKLIHSANSLIWTPSRKD